MNKKFLTLIFVSLLLVSMLPLTSAWFSRDHERFTFTAFEEVNSPITQTCRPYLYVLMDGDSGADISVLHYVGPKVTSYIQTHTRSGYLDCLKEAGTDLEMKCFCYGIALHQQQDFYSHSENGFTTKYLKKFLGNNYLAHMIVERNMENANDKLTAGKTDAVSIRVEDYDNKLLNSLFPELGGNSKYLTMLNYVSGIDMSNDAKIFRSGYVGDGFYSTVYKDRVSLPFWAIVIPIALMLLGLVVCILIAWKGVTNWKWLAILFGVILIVLGALIFYTFLSGTTWKVTTLLIEVPPMFGYMKISDTDVQYYSKITQEATNRFLTTGELNIDDASGLSYEDRNGVWHEGALTKASQASWLVIGLIVALLLTALINIFFKSLIEKKARKGKLKLINKILNYSVYLVLGLILLLLIYFGIRILGV